MGDVHMILMALFLKLPVFLTEDSDIELLQSVANRRFSLSNYQLHIYSALDLMKQIAENCESKISRKELESIVKQIGERHNWSAINAIWRKTHD